MKLSIENVTKKIGHHLVIENATLQLDTPFVTALVGENGSGKSTLLRMIAGIARPDKGRIVLDDSVVFGRSAVKRHLGYVPEHRLPFPHLTVAELVSAVAALKRTVLPSDELIETLGVDAYFGQRMHTLSLGQERRVALLTALTGDPDILVLDEPTNGLDPAGVQCFVHILRTHAAAGKGVLFATHHFDLALKVADRFIEIDTAKVVLSVDKTR